MENILSKEDLTNILKIYKIFDDNEILIMINDPNLISDINLKNSLIKLINLENNALDKIKEYYDKYISLTGGKGRRGRKSKKKSRKKKSKKRKRSKKKKSKKKSKKRKKSKGEPDSIENSERGNFSSSQYNNSNLSQATPGNISSSQPFTGNNRLSGFNTGIPNITINNNNNNGSQTIDDKNIPQVSIPLKFIINREDTNIKKNDIKDVKKDVKNDKKKGGRNIEINKSDGLDILKRSLESGETEFNLTFDFTKDIEYKDKDFSNLMSNVKSFVKDKVEDVTNNKDIPEFKNELKEKINSINNLLPPFYSQNVVLP